MNFTKALIQNIADKTQFISANVEKMVRLMDILEWINKDPNLQGKLALKGGTAINLCIVDCIRLSVDIDLDFAINTTREEMLIIREEIKRVINEHILLEGYKSTKRDRTHFE